MAASAIRAATLLAWQRLTAQVVRLPLPSSPGEALDLAAGALRAAPREPRLLAVTAASNVPGELWPVEGLAETAHAHGSRWTWRSSPRTARWT